MADVFFHECKDFLSASSENETVSTLKADNIISFLRFPDQYAVDLLLRKTVFSGSFPNIYSFCFLRNPGKNFHSQKIIINYDISITYSIKTF